MIPKHEDFKIYSDYINNKRNKYAVLGTNAVLSVRLFILDKKLTRIQANEYIVRIANMTDEEYVLWKLEQK